MRLINAHIKGQFVCNGAEFHNPKAKVDANAVALAADGTIFEAGASLGEGFRATGQVRLVNTRVKGPLSCRGAKFDNPKAKDDLQAWALVADGITVEGNAFLDGGFHATGAVRLPGAHIKGELNCAHGRFDNPRAPADANAVALDANGIMVEEGVFFVQGFHATGLVGLIHAKVQGALSFEGGRFENPKGVALNLYDAVIGSTLFMTTSRTFEGVLDLIECNADQLCDSSQAWSAAGELVLEGFEYRAFAGDAPRSPEDRLNWLRLQPEFHPEITGNANGWHSRSYYAAEFHTQPFEHLASVMLRMGEDRDAVTILVEKNRELGRIRRAGWLANRFVWATTRYGYAPSRALLCLLVVVLLGIAGAHFANERRMFVPSGTTCAGVGKDQNPTAADPRFHASLYVLDLLLPGLNLHQQDSWQLVPPLPARPQTSVAPAQLQASNDPANSSAARADPALSAAERAEVEGRGYMWLQLLKVFYFLFSYLFAIMAVAGFTGLIKTDVRTK